MAIKNTLLGGTDWTGSDEAKSADLNDTFDAAVLKFQNLPPWFTDEDYYTVYDDFTGDTPSDPPNASLWTVTDNTSGQGSCTISNTNNAGGTAPELELTIVRTTGSPDISAETNSMSTNRHIHAIANINMRIDASSVLGKIYFGNSTDGWTTLVSQRNYDNDSSDFRKFSILIVAKGSDVYDAYIDGALVSSSLSKSNGSELKFSIENAGTSCTSYIYIDDVRYSNYDVS